MLNILRGGHYLHALIFIFVAVFSIIMHELAHGYMAIKNGDLTPKLANRMNFNPVNHFDLIGFGMFLFVGFGWAKPVPVNTNNFNNYRKGLLQVSVAGVLLNFVFAFLSYPLMKMSINVFAASAYTDKTFELLYIFFFYFYSLNLTLCVFNLLPIYPLDGFRILESRLRRINPYINFMYKYGMYVLIGFLLMINFTNIDILGVMRNVAGYPIRMIWGLFGL